VAARALAEANRQRSASIMANWLARPRLQNESRAPSTATQLDFATPQ
jgi:hypothetical protein